VWQIPDALDTVVCAPDDGCRYHPKHVEQFPDINKLCNGAANLKFFKSRLVTKQWKLKLYRTVIRPIVTHASQTWVLKETIIQKLLVFERKILRRIFGPTKENQIWRVKTNEELDKLMKHKNIITLKLKDWVGLVTYKGCQIPEQLRRYLIRNP